MSLKTKGHADAFPGGNGIGGGLTKREYLAAHAPAQPTFEFPVWMPVPRPEWVWPQGKRPMDDIPPLNAEEVRKWDIAQAIARAAQWPWAWADAVLETSHVRFIMPHNFVGNSCPRCGKPVT